MGYVSMACTIGPTGLIEKTNDGMKQLIEVPSTYLRTHVQLRHRQLANGDKDPSLRQKLANAVREALDTAGFPAEARLEDEIDEDGDLQILCKHPTEHFEITVGPRYLIALKRGPTTPMGNDGRRFSQLVRDGFERIIELALASEGDRVPDVVNYEHSIFWSLKVAAEDDKVTNKRILHQLWPTSELFPNSRMLRGAIKASFVLLDQEPHASNGRNYWLDIDTPYNDNEALLEVALSIQSYPPELAQPTGRDTRRLWKEAKDVDTAIRLIDEHLCAVIERAASACGAVLVPRDSR